MPGDQRGRADQGRPGRGPEGGVEQRPAELVKRVPHHVRILGPLADRLKGREQLRQRRIRRHVQPERVDQGIWRGDRGGGLERAEQRADIARGRRVIEAGERHLLVARVVAAEVDGGPGPLVRKHADGDVEEAHRPAEVGEGVHPELARPAAEEGEQQQLRRFSRRLNVERDARPVQPDDSIVLGPVKQPFVHDRVVDDVGKPGRRADRLGACRQRRSDPFGGALGCRVHLG
jgi:hypothetical protein